MLGSKPGWHAGDWLNNAPLKALGLHLRPPEFVLTVKYRLGMPVFDREGPCPACLRMSDVYGGESFIELSTRNQ